MAAWQVGDKRIQGVILAAMQQHLFLFWARNMHDSLCAFELLFRLPRRFPSISETDPDTRRSRVFRVSWGPRLQSPRLFCMYIMVHANSLAVLLFSRCFSSCVALDLHPLCVLCCCVPILAVKRSLFWFSCFLSLSVSVDRNLFRKGSLFSFPLSRVGV